MRDIIASDIEALGYPDVSIDFMPTEHSKPEAVAIFEWTNPLSSFDDIGSWHYIQVQSRSKNSKIARERCEHIREVLNSGTDEIQFHAPDYLLYRPRRGPVLLERTKNTVTFSLELAVWYSK